MPGERQQLRTGKLLCMEVHTVSFVEIARLAIECLDATH